MRPSQLHSCMFLQYFTMINNRRNALHMKIMRRRKKMWDMIRQLQKLQRIMLMGYMKMFPIANMLEMYLDAIRTKRSIWMKSRSDHFWNVIVPYTYTDADWIKNFGIRKQTFNDLCVLLQPALEPKALLLKSREPLSVEKQVAVALYKMASCAKYCIVGNVFGIHKSTVKKCLSRVVNAINNSAMKDDYITIPNVREASQIAMNFERISRITQIVKRR